MTRPQRILMGEIVKAHGLRGEVKLKSFAADPLRLGAYGALETDNGARVAIESLRQGAGTLIARIAGVSSRAAAEALGGTKLYVARARLPEAKADEFYHADLIGLAARAEGREVGRIAAVHDFGAGGVIEIERGNGEPLLVSFSAAMVKEVNVAGGYVELVPEALS